MSGDMSVNETILWLLLIEIHSSALCHVSSVPSINSVAQRGVLKFVTMLLWAVYKGRPANGDWGGGGFEISDIPGRGEGVVCESSDVRKFLKKSKFQNFSKQAEGQ